MNPHISYISHLLSLLLCLGYLACAPKSGEQAPISWAVTFFPLGAKVEFDATIRENIQKVTAFDSEDRLVAQLDLGGYARSTESLYFRWEKGQTYRFEVMYQNGKSAFQTVRAPQTDPRGAIEIAIPYGTIEVNKAVDTSVGTNLSVSTPTSTQKASLVLQGVEMKTTVLIRNGLEAPVTFHMVLQVPASFQVLPHNPVWDSEAKGADLNPTVIGEAVLSYHASGKFTVESEVWYSQLTLKIPDEPLPKDTQIRGHVFFENASGDRWERSVTTPLRSASLDEIAAQLRIEDIIMPTGPSGISDPRQRSDTISSPRPLLGGLGKWFGAKASPTDEFEPVAYQTVHIHNQGKETVHAIVASMNRDTQDGEPVPFLSPPDAVNAGTNRSLAFVSLMGESTTPVPLPIYLNPLSQQHQDSIGEGQYERAIEVKIWGSDATALRATRPLLIVTPNLHALLVTSLVTVVTGLGIGLLLCFHSQLFTRFSTKQLILISLFGTTIFIAVNVPSTLLTNLISALLGPISSLVTGLINEMLYYALLTSLLILIPKFGVITLVTAVRLLLGGVTLGLLTPTILLHAVTAVLLLEVGFQIARKITLDSGAIGGANLLTLALIFGLCDALTVYIDFQLSMTLYRLFYADWYILTRILIDGFTYTFIGVLLGKRLGSGLWRVAE
ncbi:hypothetical protein C6496_23865 [Candidatus Poribacteria bacterium]|nr:MAG: hypothetical protein C6496_23865 [Candidatus Poribacteria bacterium]